MNEENIKAEDFIHLPPLKKITIQFLRFIFYVVDLLIDIVKKTKLLLLTGLIAGLAAGFLYYSSRSPIYEVSMIAESSTVYRKTLADMIQSLNELIVSQSYRKLATELDISEQHARQISFIELTGLFNESLQNDTSTKYNQPFKVNAHITNTELTDTFQNAVLKYLDNKPFFIKRREERIKFDNEKLSYIEKDLAKLDTLKTEYNRFFASSKISTTYYSNNADPSNIYKQGIDLVKEKGITLYRQNADSNPIQVIDEFKSPSLPQSSSRFQSMTYAALIGLGISFLLSLYIELYRKTRNYKGGHSI